jgi:hypothetical protein
MSPKRLTGEARDKERTYLAKRYRQGAALAELDRQHARALELVPA